MTTIPVTNHLLWIAYRSKNDADLTPAKLQKLLYFLHGWYLAVTGSELFDEPFIRGTYGPVLLSLEALLSSHSATPVDDYIPEWDEHSCEMKPFFVNLARFPQFGLVLEKVWDQYGSLELVELSTMARTSGSPWACATPGEPLSAELIKASFVGCATVNR